MWETAEETMSFSLFISHISLTFQSLSFSGSDSVFAFAIPFCCC
jgi:hypothetical protein